MVQGARTFAAEPAPAADDPPRQHALCGARDLLFLTAIAGVVQW
jgi:hypothetical protein